MPRAATAKSIFLLASFCFFILSANMAHADSAKDLYLKIHEHNLMISGDSNPAILDHGGPTAVGIISSIPMTTR